jgi:hypothetical protein
VDYRVDFKGIPWEEPMAGVRQKVMRHGDKRLRLVEYSRDLKPHWCERGHIGYLLEGELEIKFDSGVVMFEAGDGIFIPPGPEHRHMAGVLSREATAIFVEEV